MLFEVGFQLQLFFFLTTQITLLFDFAKFHQVLDCNSLCTKRVQHVVMYHILGTFY